MTEPVGGPFAGRRHGRNTDSEPATAGRDGWSLHAGDDKIRLVRGYRTYLSRSPHSILLRHARRLRLRPKRGMDCQG